MRVKLAFNGKLKTLKFFIGLSCAHTVAITKKKKSAISFPISTKMYMG